MKTVAIFTAHYLPHLGGVERYTYNVAAWLQKNSFNVIIITSKLTGYDGYEIVDGIKVYRLPAFSLMGGRFPVIKPGPAFISTLRKLTKVKIDFGIIQTRFYTLSLFASAFLKIKKIKNIVIDHGTDHFTVNNRVLDALGHIYEHTATFFMKRFCKSFYGVSEATCRWLRHYNIQASGILYNAIDFDKITEILSVNKKNFRQGLPENAVIVAYAGRLIKEKGILKLINAIKSTGRKDLFLFAAGDGELYDRVKSESKANINALGKLSFEDVVALMSQSRVFCLPTDYPEGFPTSVLEAAVCGAFIIATQAGGSKELVIDDSYGIILPHNTEKEIADSIIRAADNNGYRDTAVFKTRERVKEHFTWDITCGKIIKIINGAVNGQA